MKYKKLNNKIIIEDLEQFNIVQILDCGQIFRYYIQGDVAEVVSGNKYAQIFSYKNRVEIVTEQVDYFANFFDLNNDYEHVKEDLKNDSFLSPAIKFGYGIRILNQPLFEMIVSFIISANNNIKRIKNSLNKLSEKFGTKTKINLNKNFNRSDAENLYTNTSKNVKNKNFNCVINRNNVMSDCEVEDEIEYTNIVDSPLSKVKNCEVEYYAFPTLEQLKEATVQDYVDAGLGYRAEYMYHTIQRLTNKDLTDFEKLDEDGKLQFLLSLKGVGEKVAHCILLFATHNTNLFPVDTWINKVYNDLTGTTSTNRKAISKELTARYGNLSGYAQQYFFYYYRSVK